MDTHYSAVFYIFIIQLYINLYFKIIYANIISTHAFMPTKAVLRRISGIGSAFMITKKTPITMCVRSNNTEQNTTIFHFIMFLLVLH